MPAIKIVTDEEINLSAMFGIDKIGFVKLKLEKNATQELLHKEI